MYCCHHVIILFYFYFLFNLFTIYPVASVLEMRCREYLRLFYILVVFMYVYKCVYIHTHLHLSFLSSLVKEKKIPLMLDSVDIPLILFFLSCCGF